MHVRDAYDLVAKAMTPLLEKREAQNVARLLLEDGFRFADPKRNREELSPEEEAGIKSAIERLQQGEPLQYVLGFAHFYGLRFKVDPRVLIPRPETEELVDWVLKSEKSSDLHVIDIGTGSGCIAITLKKKRPGWDVIALEESKEALDLAKENATSHEVALKFLHRDIRDTETWPTLPTLDLLVSNPPYIAPEERDTLPKQVLDYEPDQALFTSSDPLEFYRVLAQIGRAGLRPGGRVYLECSEIHAGEVQQLFAEQTHYRDIELRQDMQGKKRMLRAIRNDQ